MKPGFARGGSLAAAVTALVTLFAPRVAAQVPSSDNVIYACVRLDDDGTATKSIRLVSADTICRRDETRLQWNVVGLRGPQGGQGIQGIPGPQGIQGPQGVVGPQGERGPIGPAGETGVTGPAGPTGATGPTGPQGPAGTTGQNAITALSTASLQLSSTSVGGDIPGLTQTVNVSNSNSLVLVSTDGSLHLDSIGANDAAIVDLYLFRNDQRIAARRIFLTNKVYGQDTQNWSFGLTFALPAGSSTFKVVAVLASQAPGGRVFDPAVQTNGPLTVSVASPSFLPQPANAPATAVQLPDANRGTLTVTILNR